MLIIDFKKKSDNFSGYFGKVDRSLSVYRYYAIIDFLKSLIIFLSLFWEGGGGGTVFVLRQD